MTSTVSTNNAGLKLIVTASNNDKPIDLSDAISLLIYIKKPNGTLLEKQAALLTNGLDGKIYYITQQGDLDISGIYKIQGKILADGAMYYTDIVNFSVFCNL